MFKKALASFLCAALILTGAPSPRLVRSAFASEEPAIDPAAAAKFFQEKGVLKGPDDPQKSYFFDANTGKLNEFGRIVFKYFKAETDRSRDYQESFEEIRKGGEFTEKKRKAVQSAIKEVQERFGGIDSADPEDGFMLGAKLNAIMTGVMSAEGPKQDFTRVNTPEGYVFMDDKGVAFRASKAMACRAKAWPEDYEPLVMSLKKFQEFKAEKEKSGEWDNWTCGEMSGLTTFSRDLAVQQKRMNKERPPCAPIVPETGRYNFEMLQYSYCKMETQVGELDKSWRIDRMVRIAQLLGKQYRDDQWFKDSKLERDLLAEARKKKVNRYDGACGREVTDVLDLVDCRLAKRVEYLGQAKEKLALFKSRMQRYAGADSIANEDVEGMRGTEFLVSKYVFLTFLETQRFHTINQAESLGYEFKTDPATGKLALKEIKDGPDAKALEEALKNAPADKAGREAYGKRRLDIARKFLGLMNVFRGLEGDLTDADLGSAMGAFSAALQSAQRRLGEIGLDFQIYSAMPGLLKVAKDENSGLTPAVSWGGAKLVNKISKFWGGNAAGGYLKDRALLDKYQPGLKNVFNLIAAGDFKGARAAIIAMDPEAARTHSQTGLGGGGELSDAQTLQAVLKKTQETLGGVTKVHVWTGLAVNIVVWSAVLAVAAPVASAALSGVARMAYSAANTVAAYGKVGKALSFALRVTGEVAEHAAIRLQTLSPAADKLYGSTKTLRAMEAAGVRFVNASGRMAAFSLLLSGPISGVMGAGTHAYETHLGKDHSPFSSAAEAFMMGYQQGAHWATDSWHPLLLYVGLPSSAFEGTKLAAVADGAAGSGLVGNMNALGRYGLERAGAHGAASWMGEMSLQNLAKGGGLRSALATGLGMADNIGKYYVVSAAAGEAGRAYSWRFSRLDPDNAERALKRAEQEAQQWMQAPIWLAIPVFPAKYEVQAQAAQRSQQGMKEYKESGELHLIANAAADITELPLKNSPEVPVMQKVFNLRWRGESGEHGKFRVSKEMKYEAIREELPNAVRGGSTGVKIDPFSVNPMEYYRVSQMEDNKMIGRLYVNDEVRDQAQGLFEKSILKNTKLAEGILSAKTGTRLEGFGTVRPGHQEEVARILYRAGKDGTASVPKAQLEASAKLLKPYLESEELVSGKAKELLSALQKNTTPGKDFQSLVETMMQRTQQWKGNQGGPHADSSKSYVDLLGEFRQQAASKKGSLSPQESAVVGKTIEYLETIHQRFQYFNKTETFTARVKSALEAIATEYKGGASPNAQVSNAVEGFLRQTLDWASKNRSTGEAVLRVGENPKSLKPADFLSLMGNIKTQAEALKPQLAAADYKVVESAVKELEAAPWLLHDSKGTNLQGWRPEQFEGLMYFLYSLTRQGTSASEVVRTFLMMKTGAGKTLIAYEGLLPIADADAASRGKQTIFLTVQSNLESQARIEFRSMKKLSTKMQIDTWENFKTRIAQGKLKSDGGPDDWWILGDEMDGAALQPALTIGETTASVSKESMGYRMLKGIGKRMEVLLDRGPAEVKKRLEAQVRRQQATLEGMEAGEARESLQENAQGLLRMTRELDILQTRSFTQSENKSQALQRGRGWLKRLTQERGDSGAIAELQELVGSLEKTHQSQAAEPMARLDGKLRELWTAQNQADLVRVEGKIESLVSKQRVIMETMKSADRGITRGSAASGDLGAADAGALRELWAAGEDILQTVAERKTLAAADGKFASRQIEMMLLEQKSVLVQSESAGQAAIKHLQSLADSAERSGKPSLASEYKAQAARIAQDAATAREGIQANAKSISEAVKAQAPGWENQVRELLSERESLVGRAVARENPIYEIFGRMRQDMYSMVRSTIRVQDDSVVLRESPKKAGQALRDSAESFLRRVEALASGEKSAEALVAEAKAQRSSWDARAEKLSKMLDSPQNARHEQLLAERGKAYEALWSAEAELRSAKAEFEAADPGAKAALKEKVAATQKTVDLMTGRVSELHRTLSAYEGPQRDAVRTALRDLLSDSQQTAGAWEAKISSLKGPEADALRSEMRSWRTQWESQLKRLDYTSDRANAALQRRIDGVGTGELAARYALKWTGMRWALSKVPGLSDAPMLQPITQSTEGLSRTYARGLVREFLSDPFLPPEVRWKMFWSILPSTLWPRGMSGNGSGWVRTELFNLARGYLDNPANVRVDNITGRINVIHNGQWFESMDTPTRRYWELQYGTDLTLPYEHKTMVTMNDFIRDNHNVRFVGFSGTAGKEFYNYLSGNKVDIVGKGSTAAPGTQLEVHAGPAGKFNSIGEAIRAAKTDAQGLVVLSVSDTQMVKAVRRYLLKTGMLQPDNIAMVFSDAELLRLNRPEAQVGRQMNLDGLTTGKVKVLILDTRVGGRGLDLNFKGDRGNPSPSAFKGYKNFQMLIVDPHEMSGVHSIQAQGRIDLGRILPGAQRSFKLVMDIQSAGKDPVFLKMIKEEPVFQQLRDTPEARRMALEAGKVEADWPILHSYVESLEKRGASPALTELYRRTVDKYLSMRQDVVEQEALRSASVLNNQAAVPNPMFRGLFP